MDRFRCCSRFAIVVACLGALLGTWLASAAPASAATQTWDTPGAYDWLVPAGVTTATFQVSGAQGAGSGASRGGAGGRTVGTVAVTPGETLKINVGGAGAVAGFGGGN